MHVACFALVDLERPLLSALVLADDDENDGHLTALEVSRSKVPADLVVLACDQAARGRIDAAGGSLGLPHAFLRAGGEILLSHQIEAEAFAQRQRARREPAGVHHVQRYETRPS